MQTELIILFMEFVNLRSVFTELTLFLLIISWSTVRVRAGRTMTKRKYCATLMALGVVIPPFHLFIPLAIMASNHPDLFTEFVDFMIAESPFELFLGPLIYVLIGVMGGWVYAMSNPADEKHENLPESQPEPVERQANP